MIEIDDIATEISRMEMKRSECLSAIREAEKIIEEKDLQIEQFQNLQSACQIVASALQQSAHKKISSIVTKCLNIIFDDPYQFKIEFERKRGKTEAKPVFIRDKEIIDDPMNASGGGAIDVAAFALRLAAIVLAKPTLRKTLVLDEPFKYVSQQYRPRIGQLLREISQGYDVQIIMVTHINELKIGTVCTL